MNEQARSVLWNATAGAIQGCWLGLLVFTIYLAAIEPKSTLGLIGWKVTNAGLKELAHQKHLQVLDLGNTLVTDDGLQELTGLTSLKAIYLDGTAVSDKGLKWLRERLPKCWITREKPW